MNGSMLDVMNNHFIVKFSGPNPVATIRGYLTTGYDGGAWNGPGINSSSAAANAGYALGYANGADGVVSGLSAARSKSHTHCTAMRISTAWSTAPTSASWPPTSASRLVAGTRAISTTTAW